MLHTRPRPIFILTTLLSVGLLSTLLYRASTGYTLLSSSSTRPGPDSSSPSRQLWGGLATWLEPDNRLQPSSVLPVEVIEAYYRSHLGALTATFDREEDETRYGLVIGPNYTLTTYTTDLMSLYDDYLAASPPPGPWLSEVISRLSLRPSSAPLSPCPKQIMTTDKSIEHLPAEFARWKEVMPTWRINYFDDAALEGWVEKVFGGSAAQRIWKELPQRVLQTDVFRYMAMLVEGGIYTDSDTAPIIHADSWGQPYEDVTPPLLVHLSRLISLATTPSASNPIEPLMGDEEALAAFGGSASDDADEPALVISIEADAIGFKWENWREMRMARAVQITQWTFQARPGHPVFLDALGRALQKAEEVKRRTEEAEAKGELYTPESALEWTGPGVFTDCVYRYLLARYGFRPEQLIDRHEPTRIGDVLILPAGSFSSANPFKEEKQRPWAAVWHGFSGRWREDDPGQKEFEEELKEELGEGYRPISEDHPAEDAAER